MGQGSLLLGAQVFSSTARLFPSVCLLSFHPTADLPSHPCKGLSNTQSHISSIFWKGENGGINVLDASVIRNEVTGWASHTSSGTIPCWTSQGWRVRVGTEEQKKATFPAFLFSSYGVHNPVHLAFFGCAPPKCLLFCHLVKQGVPPQSIRQMHWSHVEAWETSSCLFGNSPAFCLNALSLGNFSLDWLMVLLSYSET